MIAEARGKIDLQLERAHVRYSLVPEFLEGVTHALLGKYSLKLHRTLSKADRFTGCRECFAVNEVVCISQWLVYIQMTCGPYMK